MNAAYFNFLGRLGSNGFLPKWSFGTHGNWENKNSNEHIVFSHQLGINYYVNFFGGLR